MSATDIIIFVILGGALVYGAIRGAIRQIGTFAAFVAGILVCRIAGGALIWRFCPDGGTFAVCCCYVLLFLVSFAVVMLVAHLLRGTARKIGLGTVDRIAGSVLAILVAGVVISACLNVYFAIVPDAESAFCTPSMPWRGALVKLVPVLVGYAANT